MRHRDAAVTVEYTNRCAHDSTPIRHTLDLGISGKRVIVTGGSRGIGRATARQFLQEGARVLICARDGAAAQAARDELAAETQGDVHATQADMSREADIKALVDTAVAKLGGVDVLINNAGTMYSGRFAALNDEALKLQLETKLFGFMRAIRLVSPLMRAQKWGRIVNLIRGAGKEPDPYMFGSGMTNSALLSLTKSLSTEFGEDNVLVNAVCPGWVDCAVVLLPGYGAPAVDQLTEARAELVWRPVSVVAVVCGDVPAQDDVETLLGPRKFGGQFGRQRSTADRLEGDPRSFESSAAGRFDALGTKTFNEQYPQLPRPFVRLGGMSRGIDAIVCVRVEENAAGEGDVLRGSRQDAHMIEGSR